MTIIREQTLRPIRDLILEAERLLQSGKSVREFHKGVMTNLANAIPTIASTRYFKGDRVVDTLYDKLYKFKPKASEGLGTGFDFAIDALKKADEPLELSKGETADLLAFLQSLRLYLVALIEASKKEV